MKTITLFGTVHYTVRNVPPEIRQGNESSSVKNARSERKKAMSVEFPKPQRLQQKAARDCSVPVFAELLRISEQQLCAELPLASEGKVSVDGWMTYLAEKGCEPEKRDDCRTDKLPCVHLVGPKTPRSREDFHWIYRDEDGDVHDPDPSFKAMPADDSRMRDLSVYGRTVLTISLGRQPNEIIGGNHSGPQAGRP
jgi:hypothetical protein